MPSPIGVRTLATTAAMAWARASIPVLAVMVVGIEWVRSGSTSAYWARRLALAMPFLRPASGSETTEPPDTSEPVPALVGHGDERHFGHREAGLAEPGTRRRWSPSWAHRRAALAVSMTDPPPMATTAVAPEATRARVAASTISMVGSAAGLSNRVTVSPARPASSSEEHGGRRVVLLDSLVDHQEHPGGTELGEHAGEGAGHALAEADLTGRWLPNAGMTFMVGSVAQWSGYRWPGVGGCGEIGRIVWRDVGGPSCRESGLGHPRPPTCSSPVIERQRSGRRGARGTRAAGGRCGP